MTRSFPSSARPRSPYVVQAGTVIPAALITGIHSDLPGQVTAQVTEHVYDTPTGKFLPIPQGARLIGQYDSQVAFGQKRVLLVWKSHHTAERLHRFRGSGHMVGIYVIVMACTVILLLIRGTESKVMTAWRRVIALSIGEDDLAGLVSIARSRTEPASRVERARMLLAYRDDPSFYAVGRALGVHHQTVERCVERALAYGPLAALDDSPRPGKEP